MECSWPVTASYSNLRKFCHAINSEKVGWLNFNKLKTEAVVFVIVVMVVLAEAVVDYS